MESAFSNILVDMGFSQENAEKALAVTNYQGVEPAMEWLLAHSEELNNSTSQASTSESSTTQNTEETCNTLDDETAKSIKCEECGKLFRTQEEVEFHSAKSGHINFAESTEEKKALSEEEKQKQLQLLEEKLKEKRKIREEKEKVEEFEKEKNRIKTGKQISEAKKKHVDEEMRKAIESRKREKEEETKARQRVLQQIEEDKLRRNMALDGNNSPPKIVEPPPVLVQKPKGDYKEARLQMRLTDGKCLIHTFGAKEQLSAVRLYIEMNRTDDTGSFYLMTNFPKKVFTMEDFEKPLDALGLVPSAVIIVVKSTS